MPTFAPITLERFITEDFFTLLGLEDMSEEGKAEILEALNKTVQARVYAQMYEQLTDEQQEHLDDLAPGQMVAYLQSIGFDVAKIIAEESVNYRMEVAKLYESILAPMFIEVPEDKE